VAQIRAFIPPNGLMHLLNSTSFPVAAGNSVCFISEIVGNPLLLSNSKKVCCFFNRGEEYWKKNKK